MLTQSSGNTKDHPHSRIHRHNTFPFLFLLYPTCFGLGPAWSILSYTEGLALQGPGQRVVITDFM